MSELTNEPVHTQINENLRISSIYRHYGNLHFSLWAWETLLWENENVIEQYDVEHNRDSVIKLHNKIKRVYTRRV